MILAASQRMHRPAMLGLQIYIEAGRGGHCRQPPVSPSIKAGGQQGKRTSGPLSRGPTLFKAHNCALLSLPAAFCSPLRLRRRDSASIGFSVLRSRAVLAHSHSLRLLASFAAYPTRAPSPPLPPPRFSRRRGWRPPTSSGPTRSTPGRSSMPRPSPTPWSTSAPSSRVLFPSLFSLRLCRCFACLLYPPPLRHINHFWFVVAITLVIARERGKKFQLSCGNVANESYIDQTASSKC